jgi:hypothetical protein
VASTYDATFAVYRSLYPALREAMYRLGDLDPTD